MTDEQPPRLSVPGEEASYDRVARYLRRRHLTRIAAVLTVLGATVYLFHPWFAGMLTGEPPYFEWDVAEQYWPDLVYLCDSIHDGELPYWNAHDRGGYPAYADPQAGTYHPGNWALCALGGRAPALSWAVVRVIASFFLAGLFGLLFLRRVGATFAGAILGAVLIEAAPFMRHNWELILTSGFAYAPAMLWAADRLAVERRIEDGMWLALAFAACAWVGSPPAMFQAASLTGLYLAFRLGEQSRGRGARVLRQGLPALSTAAILTVGLCGAVVGPGLELAEHSVQAGRSYESFTDGSLSGPELIALVWPQEGNHLYVGWLALALCPLALARRKDRQAWFFLAIALLSIGMVMGTHGPVFRVAHALVPGVSMFRLPHRYEAWLGIAVATLAAFGLTELQRWGKDGQRADKRILWVVGGVLLASAVGLGVALPHPTPALFCGALAVIALGLSFEAPSMLRVGSAAVGVTLAVLGLLDVTQELPDARHMRSDAAPGRDAVAELILPHAPGTDRAYRYMDEFTMSCRSGTRYRRRDLRGYQDPLLLASYERVVGNLREHPELAPQFNVRYALQGPHFIHGWNRHYLPPPDELAERLRSEVVYRDDEERVVTELHDTLPYAYFVADTDVDYAADRSAALARVIELAPSAVLVLEGEGPTGRARPGTLPESVARTLRTHRDRLWFDITARRPGYVVVNEAFYPGWTAEVDGEPAEVVRANGFVRAIRVDAGAHQILMSFLPEDGVYWREALLLSVFVVFAGLVLFPLTRRFRQLRPKKRRRA